MDKDKEFKYNFLRQEMQNLVARQDNFFSMTYTTTVALWTIAVSISNEWIIFLALLLTFLFSLKICDIWRGTMFLSAYIKICLEEKKNNGWETIRDNYYVEFPASFKRKAFHCFSKLSLPILNIASCVIFWILHGIDFKTFFYSWQNILLLSFQFLFCLGCWKIWNKNYDNPEFKKYMQTNWSVVKQKYLNESKMDLQEKE